MLNVHLHVSRDLSERIIRIKEIEHPLWYKLSLGDSIPLQKVHNLDFVAIALLPLAMRLNQSLRIYGPVTSTLLDNLESYQSIWSDWLPERFKKIDIIPDAELLPTSYPHSNTAVALASGGVDSSFMLLRHVNREERRLNHNICSALLVHGFDMPLTSKSGFDKLHSSVKSITDALKIPLSTVKTNWKNFCPDWEMMHPCGLASIMHQFGEIARAGLIALDDPYRSEAKVWPWGNNSLTNPLLSGDRFNVISCGGNFTRSTKVDYIAKHPNVLKNIIVCWQGARDGYNCGECEKCIRTKLNLLVAKAPHPWPFRTPLTSKQVAELRATNFIQLAYLEEILGLLESSKDIDHPDLVKGLQQAIHFSREKIHGK